MRLISKKTKIMLSCIPKWIQGKKPVHFLHIGKTGGSAIKFALGKYPVDGQYALHLHKHGVRLSDIPQGDQIIFAVRDPLSRFVSGFYSRQRQGQPRIYSSWSPAEKKAFEYFSTPNQLAVALSSENPEEKEMALMAMRRIGHVNSSYWDWFKDEDYFRSRLKDIFFVGFQERLTEDFEILKRKLGMPENAKLPNDEVSAHKNPDGLDRKLTNEAVENLTRWYRDDYKFIYMCRQIMEE